MSDRVLCVRIRENLSESDGAMETLIHSLFAWFSQSLNVWVLFGLLGQGVFMMRFVCQWWHSERLQRSEVPEVFWYLSLIGSIIVLIYAVHQRDPVFILGQSLGAIIYIRNLQLIVRHKRLKAASVAMGETASS